VRHANRLAPCASPNTGASADAVGDRPRCRRGPGLDRRPGHGVAGTPNDDHGRRCRSDGGAWRLGRCALGGPL